VSLVVIAGASLGFVVAFYLGTAFMRSILQGPEAAMAFLKYPWGFAGQAEVMWGLVIGAIGLAVSAMLIQRLLVRWRVMSQTHAENMWKDN
jgi:hypothetical protein